MSITRPGAIHTATNLCNRWRFPIACQILFSGLVLVCSPFICETPRWLAKHGRQDEARHTIARLLDKDDDDPEVKGQLNEILEGINIEKDMGEPTWNEVFSNATKTRNLQRVVLGMGPFMMNQWSGINVLCYYLAYILENYLDFSIEMSLILASVAFTQYAIFSWPPFFYIDKIGRRWTVILSSAGCAACMFIIAGCLLSTSYACAAAATAFMFLYMDCFTMGILPVSWSYAAEVQPLRVRNKSMAVGVFSHWLSNFVVVMVTPIGLNNIGGNFFWIWGVICALFIPLTYFFGIETSGRTLEQVDRMFYDEPRILMGLNPKHRAVIKASKEDEENRFKAIAKLGERSGSVADIDDTIRRESIHSIEKA